MAVGFWLLAFVSIGFTQDESEIAIEEETIQIIDTAQIELAQRSKFDLASDPKFIHAIAIYSEERLWNFPPMLAPKKATQPIITRSKNHHFNLYAHPSLPSAFFYRITAAGSLPNKISGFFDHTRKQLGDEQTNDRGDYNLDQFRGGTTLNYQPQSHASIELDYRSKSLKWQTNRDLSLIRSTTKIEHYIRKNSAIHVDLLFEKFDNVKDKLTDSANDLRIAIELENDFPILNPIRIFGVLESQRLTKSQKPAVNNQQFQIGFLDRFNAIGSGIFQFGGDLISFLESDQNGETQTRFHFDPKFNFSIPLNDQWNFLLNAYGEIDRPKISRIYFETDYVRINPFLRPEKNWCGDLGLKFHDQNVEVNASAFVKQTTDLVVFEREDQEITARNFTVDRGEGSDSVTLIYGGKLALRLNLERLKGEIKLISEWHKDRIDYRPKRYLDANLRYRLPIGFEFGVNAEFRGGRSVDGLQDYFLIQPKLSQELFGNLQAFISGTVTIGELAQFEDYPFTPSTFDFGVELRF